MRRQRNSKVRMLTADSESKEGIDEDQGRQGEMDFRFRGSDVKEGRCWGVVEKREKDEGARLWPPLLFGSHFTNV